MEDQGIELNETSIISDEKSLTQSTHELLPEVIIQPEMIRLRRTSAIDAQFKSTESKPTVSSEASNAINNAYAFSMGRQKQSHESQKQKP